MSAAEGFGLRGTNWTSISLSPGSNSSLVGPMWWHARQDTYLDFDLSWWSEIGWLLSAISRYDDRVS